jgi:subtilisin family serine protease/subtilisin-like proprotein convertase family protein
MSIKLLKTSLALIPLTISLSLSANVADPLTPQQWHLKNNGQKSFSTTGGIKGSDLRVRNAHKRGIRGQGIQVTVIDTGVQIAHKDLAQNITSGSRDLLNGGNNPVDTNGHGTAVAGLIAAVGYNNEGVRGIAPSAELNGFNFLEEQSLTSFLASHGKSEGTKNTHVFNQSYGGGDIFPRAYDIENDLELAITEDTFKSVSMHNAQGRGAAFVKSAGNGFNFFGFSQYFILPGNYFSAADDGEIRNHGLPMENSNAEISDSNFWNVVVSAFNASDKLSSYSSVGSNVFMTATGGEFGSDSPAMVTIDLMGCDAGFNTSDGLGDNQLHGGTAIDPECDYTSVMNGTSSAAPSMSGAIAMVMSANNKITARDAKHILAVTASKVDAQNEGVILPFSDSNGDVAQYQAVDAWQDNAAGYPFHLFYGLGKPNINKAVNMAKRQGKKRYKKLPKLRITPWMNKNTHLAIPDAQTVGATSIYNVKVGKRFIVEGVQIKLDLDHARLSDLSIELISPSGTRSVLMTPNSGAFLGQNAIAIPLTGMRDQLMLSTNFYGETAKGNWRLKVVDVGGEGDGDWILYDRTTGSPSLLEPANNVEPGIITNWSIRFFGHRGKKS